MARCKQHFNIARAFRENPVIKETYKFIIIYHENYNIDSRTIKTHVQLQSHDYRLRKKNKRMRLQLGCS